MAYFNGVDNPDFYASSASSELEAYPFLGQGSAWPTTGGSADQTYSFSSSYWTTAGQPGPPAGSPTSLRATAGYESVASATSYVTQNNGYGQPSYTNQCWPVVHHQAQPSHSGFLSQDGSLASVVASETVVPTPSSVPLHYWRETQNGPSSTSTFCTQNVPTSYQHNTGPTRAGTISTERFWPYGRFQARLNGHRNAEAGPSTIVPPSVPYVGPPALHPPGGLSETTADAEKQQTITEEYKVPATKRARRTRGHRPRRPYREQVQKNATMLCEWVRQRKKLPETPSLNKALKVAAGIIANNRPLEYQEHRLATRKGKRTAAGVKTADDEFKRRNVERELFQELSQRYRLSHGQTEWAKPSLLSLVIKDLEDFSPLQGPSDELAP